MSALEVGLDADGCRLPGTVHEPSVPLRGSVVLAHPSGDGSRDQPLFRHLATTLPAIGVAVLAYDRRASEADVPVERQAADLRIAIDALHERHGPHRSGIWGASQGAWAALAAAVDRRVDFLVLVGCSAVSPARQMRYGVVRRLRTAGFDGRAATEAETVRAAYEDWVRGTLGRAAAQRAIDGVRRRDWFPLAHVPAALPAVASWGDLDLEPAPMIARLRRPVLVFYGDDEWVPVDESLAVWRRECPAGLLTERTLPDSGHLPSDPAGRVDPVYSTELLRWVDARLDTPAEVIEHPFPSE